MAIAEQRQIGQRIRFRAFRFRGGRRRFGLNLYDWRVKEPAVVLSLWLVGLQVGWFSDGGRRLDVSVYFIPKKV